MSENYYEKIARINLTTGEIREETPEPGLMRSRIGGRGLGAHILWEEGAASADALSPENKLLCLTGPMTDTAVPSFGRYMIVTKSPQTGAIACSNPGGVWGVKLKRAGFDAIIIEGCAPDWRRIHIADRKIEVLDARDYAGMTTTETDDALKALYGAEASALCIGPAGEAQALPASIMNDKTRAAGKGGAGAVMGSKKLKAITVCASRADLCESACRRCPVSCRHRTNISRVGVLCDELGLDAVALQQAVSDGSAPGLQDYADDVWNKLPPVPELAEAVLAWAKSAAWANPAAKNKKADRPDDWQNLTAVIDSMGGCMFAASMREIQRYADLLRDVTGFGYTPDELLAIGAEIRRTELLFTL